MECQLGELSETEYTVLKEQCANSFNDKQVMKEYNSWTDYISSSKISPIIFWKSRCKFFLYLFFKNSKECDIISFIKGLFDF